MDRFRIGAVGLDGDSRPSTPDGTVNAVHDAIAALIDDERPTVAAVATRLGIRVRTLQRFLAAGGTTFGAILDRYRLVQSITLLRDGHFSVTDIAFRLGYSDSAHFTRAFRRWTGECPRTLIQTRRAESGSPGMASNGKPSAP